MMRGKILQCVTLMIASVLGFVCGQRTLEPGTDYYCPNETVTFTCSDSQIIAILWVVPDERSIRYVVEQGLYIGQTFNRTNRFSSIITNITNKNGCVADVTTKLTVDTYGLENGISIKCTTYTNNTSHESSSSLLYFPGLKFYSLILYNYSECLCHLYSCTLLEEQFNHIPPRE